MAQSGTVQAGEMDRRVSIFHRVLSKNAQGEDVPSWPEAYALRVSARKHDLRGEKRLLAQEFSTDQWTEWRLRWRSDISITDRVKDEQTGAMYEVTNISEVGRREAADLLCRAIVNK
jgi:SPP1 family predicted phage head-tail adaptor